MACAAESPLKVTDEQLSEKLQAHCGILTYVAVALGISRTTIHKRVKNSPLLQQVRDQARAAIVNVAESKLLSAIEQGSSWAIRYTLNTLGRAEGFGPPLPRPSSSRARKPQDEQDATVEPRMELTLELDDARGEIVDSAQMRLIWAIENGEPWAIKYCLSTLGRSKGYGAPTDAAPTAAAPTDSAQAGSAQTPGPVASARIEMETTDAQGAQTLDQPVTVVAREAVECVDDPSLNRECVSDEGANHEGAQTVHGSPTTRNHGDPATRAKKRRERKLRKQRIRENRRQGR